MKVFELLKNATSQLVSVSQTPRLDAEMILADVLKITRAQLFSILQIECDSMQVIDFTNKIDTLLRGVPVAYLRGFQSFWTLNFEVNPSVLIPRSETELLIEIILKLFSRKTAFCLADLGTGSGAIAVSLKHEKPTWEIHATDKNTLALELAKKNARQWVSDEIFFHLGDWCDALVQKNYFDVIVSNPPYIAKNDIHLNAIRLQHEPRDALISPENGLADLKKIIFSSRAYLKKKGWLFLEHGYDQAEKVREFFEVANYIKINSLKDLAQHERVTYGQFYFF